MKRLVYADHSATTYVKEEVLKEMLPFFNEKFGNASSVYSIGRESKTAIEKARQQVADALGIEHKSEIYFTAGGSEADNMAIKGIARANRNKGTHIITTRIEHLAILNTCEQLKREGFDITYLDVECSGIVDLEALKKAIRPDTILISIMFANNEIGTIEPIKEIGKIAREKGIIFHTDAVQAIGNVKIDVNELNIDALSLSAHKFYGPKGVGALYVKKGIEFIPVIAGGHQEKNKRAGTENVAGIVGLGKAIEITNLNIDEYNKKLLSLRNSFIRKITESIPFVTVNGGLEKRLPGSINISIKGIEGEALLLMLDMEGICASSGSACNSGSIDPSHVLTAIGLTNDVANSSIRFTFGEENTMDDINYIVEKLTSIVERLRKVAPIKEENSSDFN